MCGIAGFYSKTIANVEGRVQLMIDKMIHRGPDAGNIFSDSSISLGHRRLSIIDLTNGANQPMSDNSGRFVMVFNGEIYNYQSIRQRIEDYNFKTQSDSEVILAAFIKWGHNCLQYLNGMFALAIWDRVEESLFIARDRVGIKPFYYSVQDNSFVFASELRAVLASGIVQKIINKSAIEDYLTYYTIHGPNTIIKGVSQLMPGEFAYWKDGRFSKTTYWRLDMPKPQKIVHDYNTIKSTIREKLFQAVERRLVSDVPLGAFLSGGIDSSIIVAIMSELTSTSVDTFSIVFDEKEYDESTYSNMIADKYRTSHHPIKLKPLDFLENLPKALSDMDVPSGDGLNTYVVSKMTKEQGITVALSGLGGDELFAGYPVFNQIPSLMNKKALWAMPHFARKLGSHLVRKLVYNHRVDRYAEFLSTKELKVKNIHPIFRKLMTTDDIEYLTKFMVSQDNAARNIIEKYSELEKFDLLSQVSICEISTYTQNVLLRDTDQASMAHASEIRVPFFDHELIEYVLQVPDIFKQSTYPKKLLVEAAGNLIPDEIVFRKKMGFVFPWEYWIKNELRSFCEIRIKSLAQRELFNERALIDYWNRFIKGDKKILAVKIWMLVVLEDWLINNEI